MLSRSIALHVSLVENKTIVKRNLETATIFMHYFKDITKPLNI